MRQVLQLGWSVISARNTSLSSQRACDKQHDSYTNADQRSKSPSGGTTTRVSSAYGATCSLGSTSHWASFINSAIMSSFGMSGQPLMSISMAKWPLFRISSLCCSVFLLVSRISIISWNLGYSSSRVLLPIREPTLFPSQ